MNPAAAAPTLGASAAGENLLGNSVSYRFSHLLGIEALTAEQISFLLNQSKPFQEIQKHPLKKLATLRGKSVALAFFEPSHSPRATPSMLHQNVVELAVMPDVNKRSDVAPDATRSSNVALEIMLA